MPRPLLAIVNPTALAANLAVARERAAGRRLWAVAKANAYGHGIERAARAFAAADGLGVLEVEEAQRARAAGWRKPILLLEGAFDGTDQAQAEGLDLTLVVHCAEQVLMLERARPARPIAVYLKLDT
ncbi:MAG TPA: alanine racemase, partial [Burkholderiaceae bacterium]